MPLPEGRMLFITPTAPTKVTWADGEIAVEPFQTVVVPAAMKGVCVEGKLSGLLSCLPDRESLRNALGYRAENVAGLMD